MGLILDREQLCDALNVSDSAISAWEKKGMPTIRKGRGRGMKSLYNFDAVRAWCDETGHGQGVQALIARAMRGNPPEPTAAVHTSAQPPALDPYDAEALRAYPAVEMALLALPAALGRRGISDVAIDDVLADLFRVMEEELRARGEPDDFIAREVGGLRSMIAEERAEPGSRTT